MQAKLVSRGTHNTSEHNTAQPQATPVANLIDPGCRSQATPGDLIQPSGRYVSNSHGVAIPRDPLAVSVTGREEVGKRGGQEEKITKTNADVAAKKIASEK